VIAIANKTSRENLIKAIEILISKVLFKYTESASELWHICIEFIHISKINYKDLEINKVLQFNIDTGDAIPVYCNPHLLSDKYK